MTPDLALGGASDFSHLSRHERFPAHVECPAAPLGNAAVMKGESLIPRRGRRTVCALVGAGVISGPGGGGGGRWFFSFKSCTGRDPNLARAPACLLWNLSRGLNSLQIDPYRVLTNVWKLAGGGEHGVHRAALFPQQRGWKARPEPGACRRVPRAATLLGRAPARGWWRLQPGHVPQRSHLGGFSHSPELGAVAHRPALPSFRTQGAALPSARPWLTSSRAQLPRAGRALGWESGDVGSGANSAPGLLGELGQVPAPCWASGSGSSSTLCLFQL